VTVCLQGTALAVEYFEKAAKRDHAPGIDPLGSICESSDPARALEYFRRAADNFPPSDRPSNSCLQSQSFRSALLIPGSPA
jgi:TPR repeat protein